LNPKTTLLKSGRNFSLKEMETSSWIPVDVKEFVHKSGRNFSLKEMETEGDLVLVCHFIPPCQEGTSL